MMRRRIFLWMGLSVLFLMPGLSREGVAKQTYRVRQGDTLYSISKKAGVTLEALKTANNLKDSNIKPLQILTLPTSTAVKTSKSPKPSKKTLALKKSQGTPKDTKDTAAPVELTPLKVNPELEEEGDGVITNEQAWAEIERRKKESADLLGHWSNTDEPKLLVKVAMGFLGAPYRLGGSTVTGLDCSGFVKKIYQVFDITLPRTAFEQSHIGLPVPRSELVEGDLLFFNTRRTLGHVGIYIGNNEFVHASSLKRGVRVDNLDTPYFNKRFVRAVRLKGTDDRL